MEAWARYCEGTLSDNVVKLQERLVDTKLI